MRSEPSAAARREHWRVPLRVPSHLTNSPLKAFHYGQECYFREAWADLTELGVTNLGQMTFVLFKPDGLAARAVEATLAELATEGFEYVCSTRLELDRLMMRELWRYELNLATLSRLDTIDRLLTVTPSLLVLLKDVQQEANAARRLAVLKGPSQVDRRSAGDLRARVSAKDGLLNFVHSPDEPADVVRELGVLLDRAERRRLFTHWRAGTSEALEPWWSDLPRHDLDLKTALVSVRRQLETVSDETDRRLLRRVCDEAERGRALESGPIIEAFRRLQLPINPWDEIVLLVGVTECNLKDIQSFLSMPAEIPEHE